jgi:hypothetical protein
MASSHFKESYFEALAGSIFGLSIIFCGFESVEGWETFHVGWPQWVYFTIVLVTGVFAGAAYGKRNWLAGACGGAVAGVGALLAIGLPLHVLPIVNRSLFLLFAAIGCVPGFGLFWLLRKLQARMREQIERRSSPPPGIPESAWPKALRRESRARK